MNNMQKHVFSLYSLFYRFYLRLFTPGKWHMRQFRPALKINPIKGNKKEVYYFGEKIFETPEIPFNKKIDKTIFIVGSGPSIKSTPMDMLKGEDIFCVNGSIVIKDVYGLDISYYVALDESFLKNRVDYVIDAIESGIKCFFSVKGIKALLEYDIEILKNRNNVFIVDDFYEQYGVSVNTKLKMIGKEISVSQDTLTNKRPIIFSNDLQQGVFIGGTIVYSAIQIAAALGYKKMGIIGMDLGYSGKQARFYNEDSPEISRYEEELENIIIPQMKLAKEALKDTKIYNLSLESKLPDEVFTKKTLKEIV